MEVVFISKTRKQKLSEYSKKYDHIPRNEEDRLNWMIDKYNLSPQKMEEIIQKKRMMEYYLSYTRFKIVLYEDPEGAKRPRFRLITKSNYMMAAIDRPDFVHVYSPNAADDNKYLHRLVDNELIQLTQYVQTPCVATINSYFKTPSYFNTTDVFLAEIGLHRQIQKPDSDNIAKKYFDMFNENIWIDDALVTTTHIRKFYSILPRIEIFVDYINYMTNIHQYRQMTNRKDYNPDYPIGYLDMYGRPFIE